MAECCEDKSCALEQLRARQSGTLKIVLGINAVMFCVVLAAGAFAGSSAVIAAGLVALTGSGWPDVVIGALLALLFLRSAVRVFRGAVASVQKPQELGSL